MLISDDSLRGKILLIQTPVFLKYFAITSEWKARVPAHSIVLQVPYEYIGTWIATPIMRTFGR